MRIAVTGASGFVGGAAATALAADGHEVTGFGRKPNGWAGDYRVWDLYEGPASHGSFDVVVHSAALADDWVPLPNARRANVDGTEAVLESVPGARFVHLSTSSVYDALTPTIDAREGSSVGARYLSAYSQTKAEAEQLFTGYNAVILRPHAVYGPGDTTLLPRILAGVRRRRLVLPSGGRVQHTLTHIDNLVAAIRLAVASDERGVFNVGDTAPVLLSDIVTELLQKQNRADVALASIPYATAFKVAGNLERLHRVVGGRPRLTRYAVSQLGLERTLNLDAARDRLGFTPFETTLDGADQW